LFFDSSLLEGEGGAFVREDKLDEALRRLFPSAHITRGSFTYPSRAAAPDLVWNHMDQNHRPFIHRTYDEAMRVHIGTWSAFSMTRFGKWPVVIPVFDGYFKKNGFYQVLCLFGLVVVVNLIECNGTGTDTRMDVSWAIASHRFLRFLHRPLHRRLLRLNDVQNQEDDQIRDRRVYLRAAGYRFATDVPDFLNTNVIANNVVFPPLSQVRSIALTDLPEGELRTIQIADRAYVLRRKDGAVEVWPGVCPHEGAPLGANDVLGNKIKCSWHGLEFAARRLNRGTPGVTVCGARVQLSDDRVLISPLEQA